MAVVYENERVCVEMMTGGHLRPLKAVPASIQNIDVDAVVDQEERSRVDHRRRSRQQSLLMADLGALAVAGQGQTRRSMARHGCYRCYCCRCGYWDRSWEPI